MKEITKDMLIGDILDDDPQLEDIFLRHGLNCIGCPGSAAETLAEAAEGHGVELKVLLRDLNKANEL